VLLRDTPEVRCSAVAGLLALQWRLQLPVVNALLAGVEACGYGVAASLASGTLSGSLRRPLAATGPGGGGASMGPGAMASAATAASGGGGSSTVSGAGGTGGGDVGSTGGGGGGQDAMVLALVRALQVG
jgi:hypothetical protein